MEEKHLKISVLCASRDNPEGLRTAIGSLYALASGKHNISYVVACEMDDRPTMEMASFMRPQMWRAAMDKQQPSLGNRWNNAAGLVEADVYALVTDRSVCITPNWDTVIADAFNKDDTRIVWWTTNHGPVIPIVPQKWINAAGGNIFTHYFPFWFDDTWLHELSAFVHGLPSYLIQASCFIQKRNPVTKRLRDLRFWMDFFISKRPERKEHARKIRATLGLPMPDMKVVDEWIKGTDAMWTENWQKWENAVGDKSEPDESYIEAKKMAERSYD